MTFAEMEWLNPPPVCTTGPAGLSVTTGPATDFWRETFYGFTRDSGHFLHHPVRGDFSVLVTITARYEALYDQAGLMLRLSESHWIKAGVELTDGQPMFSTVVTNGRSDWATTPLTCASPLTLRLTRHAEAIRIDLRDTSNVWRMARLGYLPPDNPAHIGIMVCSPEREGFTATFSDYHCGPAIPRTLHEAHE